MLERRSRNQGWDRVTYGEAVLEAHQVDSGNEAAVFLIIRLAQKFILSTTGTSVPGGKENGGGLKLL